MRWEETLLESRLGQPYRDYAARVPRWMPLFNRGRSAKSAQTNAEKMDRFRETALKRQAFSWRATLFSERGTLVAMALGYLLLWIKARFLSVCHRYHDATDRYGLHASPIFSTRLASGRLRSRYSR